MRAAADLTLTPELVWVAIGSAAALAGVLVIWKVLRREMPAEEMERRRRLTINRRGKLGDGEVVDIEEGRVFYSYSVSGVRYAAAQDVVTIGKLLPADRASAIGPALIKFDPRNPANSILICEEWSGLQRGERNGRAAGSAAR